MCTHPALDPASRQRAGAAAGARREHRRHRPAVPRPRADDGGPAHPRQAKIVSAGIPFAVPSADALPDRLDAVAQTAYLAFTAGYAPGSGPRRRAHRRSPGRRSGWCGSCSRLRPTQPVLVALLALMLLQHSRRDARVDEAGRIVLLPDQDRVAVAPRRGRRGGAAARVAEPHRPDHRPGRRVCRAGPDRGRARHRADRRRRRDWDRVVAHYDELWR